MKIIKIGNMVDQTICFAQQRLWIDFPDTVPERIRHTTQEFMNIVHETARDVGGEFCVSNVDEALFTKVMGKEADNAYLEKMREIKGNYSFKILIKEGDQNFDASDYAEYRWVPKENFHSVPFYVFGNNLAFLIFGDDVIVHMIQNAEIADAQRTQFKLVWETAKHAE